MVRRHGTNPSERISDVVHAYLRASLEVVMFLPTAVFVLSLVGMADGQVAPDRPHNDNPRVTQTDLRIAQRAIHILDSPARWNRADTRVCHVKPCRQGCPDNAKTFSLYCALQKATTEVTGKFDHRGAAMEEARLVVDEIAINRQDYQHRLEGYNNYPATTFPDIQKVLRLLEERISQRLAQVAPESPR